MDTQACKWGMWLRGSHPIECRHRLRTSWISVVIPGQNMELSALVIMAVTPWWAAGKLSRTIRRKRGGMAILPLYITTPSTVDKCSWNGKYSMTVGVYSLRLSDMPFSMALSKSNMAGLLDISALTLSHVTNWTESSVETAAIMCIFMITVETWTAGKYSCVSSAYEFDGVTLVFGVPNELQ